MSYVRLLATLVAGMAVIAGCNGPAERSASGAGPAAAEIGHLDAPAAQSFLAEHPEALVLDVRNPDEWNNELGHIDRARLIPLPELEQRLGEIEAWKDRPVVTVCRSGRRSQRAAEILAGAGFRQVSNLEGGMLAWRKAGY